MKWMRIGIPVLRYLARAAGARSSEPLDTWLPSTLSCSFSTRWYLNTAWFYLLRRMFRIRIFRTDLVFWSWIRIFRIDLSWGWIQIQQQWYWDYWKKWTNKLFRQFSYLHTQVRGASKIKLKKVNEKRTVTVRRVIIFLNISRHSFMIWLHCCFHQNKTLKAVATAAIVVLTPVKNLNKVFRGF